MANPTALVIANACFDAVSKTGYPDLPLADQRSRLVAQLGALGARTGAEITVDDSGLVTIAAVGGESMERARQMVQAITAEPIVGEIYEGPVKSTTAFGAFVEIMPGTEGLVHISELQWGRTEKTEDVVKKGDRVKVKLIERDERGRLRLSMKALVPKPGGDAAPAELLGRHVRGRPHPPRGLAGGRAHRSRGRAAQGRDRAQRQARAAAVQ